jgi:hypothetical protein
MVPIQYEDPIVNEVRRIREEIAAKFDYDIERIADDAENFARDWPAGQVSFDDKDPNRSADTVHAETLTGRVQP